MKRSSWNVLVCALLLFGLGCGEHGLFFNMEDVANGDGSDTDGLGDTDQDPVDISTDPSTDDQTTSTDPTIEDCGGVVCSVDQHCDSATDSCVPNDCATLVCGASEECVPNANGARCVSITCADDDSCALDRYCDTTSGTCKDDICAPGAQSCSGDDVMKCLSNGSGFELLASCDAAPSGYASTCAELSNTQAGCGCLEDWDCPGYQQCEAGTCVGSPDAPTCRLDPQELLDVLPSIEIKWGGVSDSDRVAKLLEVDGNVFASPVESPWSASGQVVATPLVANLDDDNGDGKIDDRDVPEIVFMTFCTNNDATANGIIRAIHGGGVRADGTSKKGETLLSVCAGNRYYKGLYYDSNDDVLPSEPACGCDSPEYDSTSTLAVGDVDYDGKPDIVAIGEGSVDSGNRFSKSEGFIAVLDNEGRETARTGLINFSDTANPDDGAFKNPGPSLANVVRAADPADELAEIVVGRDLFTLQRVSGVVSFDLRFTGTGARGDNGQGPVSCVADLVPGRPGMEIVAGGEVYGIPLTAQDELDTTSTQLVTLATAGHNGFCGIADVWGADPANPPGPNNPLDQQPEVLVISAGRLYVYDFDVDTSGPTPVYTMTELTGGSYVLPGGSNGGAPNVDDFDGDGFPEVGTAGALGYIVFDLQSFTPDLEECPAWTAMADDQTSKPRTPPASTCTNHADCGDTTRFGCRYVESLSQGTCICLHNGWQRATQDDSSRLTGSSVFDFNGDGAAEVIYNDECHFRIYGGFDGEEIMLELSESRTRIEYPIVADVDNDGNAEIVFATSNESGFCTNRGISCTVDSDCPSGDQPNGQKCIANECSYPDREVFNNGIEVFGDPGDNWVSARRIWNQHGYHVTNIGEDGSIPIVEPGNWLPYGPRIYNTYRSQPRSYGVAPDLVVDALQVSSPDVVCGELSQNLNIAVQISNQGDLRIGAGVEVVFVGDWGASTELLKNELDETLVFTLPASLLPGEQNIFQVPYLATNNSFGVLPDVITAIVDPPSDVINPGDNSRPDGAERECKEDNNSKPIDVVASAALADLSLTIDTVTSDCPHPIVAGTVYNDGALAAANVLVRIYAGDPGAGGNVLADEVVPLINAGESQPFSIELTGFPSGLTIALFAIVDPQNEIGECNDGNNKAGPSQEINCYSGPM